MRGSSTNKDFASTLAKGLAVLNAFGPEHPRLTLKEIAGITGLSKTTAHRLTHTLVHLGYLHHDTRSKLFQLGSQILTLGARVIQTLDLRQIARPVMERAFSELGVTMDLAILDREWMVIIYRREAMDAVNLRLPIGTRLDFHCTALGKAALSALPPEELESALSHINLEKKTSRTLTNPRALRKDLERTRKRGYSVSNEEYVQGMVAVGASLINIEGRVLGAVSFSFPVWTISVAEMEKRYAHHVVELARSISLQLM
ncbi:MAG: IclR family transcriptional regulator [Deltaproteobacteria bacterium]|nr:IclR family transcriptional regulator [Deltaproteobacteria bacterium]MBW2306680.1 IclR family transcriptional regulator [Deltaproteobacteria bacterium]